MIIIPPVIGKEEAPPPVQQPIQSSFVTFEDARRIAEITANETASKYVNELSSKLPAVISSVSAKRQPSDDDDDINLDREMRKTFYKRMSQPSFGEILSQKIDSEMSNQIVSKIVPGLFGNEGGKTSRGAREGFVGAVMDMMDTKFGLGLGESIGNNAAGLVKVLGEQRVGKLIDAYTGQGNGQQPQSAEQQLSPEERQKKTEMTIMGLDSSNPNDVNSFMQAIGISDFNEAQMILLREQEAILQRRGLPKPVTAPSPPVEAPNRPQQRPGRPQQSQSQDINRQLMNQFEESSPSPQTGSGGGQGGFFDSGLPPELREYPQPQPSPQAHPFFDNSVPQNLSHSNELNVLSLNPDDQIDIQRYTEYKGIRGVDSDIVKRMLIKEQKNLRSGSGGGSMSSDGQAQLQPPPQQIPHPQPNEMVPVPVDIKTEAEKLDVEVVKQKEELSNLTLMLDRIGSKFETGLNQLNEQLVNTNEQLVNTTSRIKLLEDEIISLKEKDKIIEEKVEPEPVGMSMKISHVQNMSPSIPELPKEIISEDVEEVEKIEEKVEDESHNKPFFDVSKLRETEEKVEEKVDTNESEDDNYDFVSVGGKWVKQEIEEHKAVELSDLDDLSKPVQSKVFSVRRK